MMGRWIANPLLCTALLLWSAGVAAIAPEEARHLLVRTGFEATPEAIAELKPLRYEHAVARLLKETRTEALTPPPPWVEASPDPERNAAQRNQRQLHRREQSAELKGWWLREMRATPSPLTERMTLFWHGHFATELRKVGSPPLMYRQNVLLRRHALGSFRSLLHEIAKDPALILYLDLQGSSRQHPDEHFAHALFQSFTLGPGPYFKERDVKEAARAFTGWRVDPLTGLAAFDARQHDQGVKIVLGRKGKLDGEQVIDTVLRHPRTAEFIVRRLWREFVSDTPDSKEVQRLAAEFRRTYQIKPLLRGLLLTPAFRAPAQRGAMVKAPVELLVGTARQFDVPIGDGRELAATSRQLGQDLFDPPGLAGWPRGAAWITAPSLLSRDLALARLLRATEMGETGADTAPGLEPMSTAQLTAVLLPIPPVDPIPAGLSSYESAAALVRDPAYQLK